MPNRINLILLFIYYLERLSASTVVSVPAMAAMTGRSPVAESFGNPICFTDEHLVEFI